MGFDIRRKIGEEWADAKYTLSQRTTCEVVTALFLIVLLIGSAVMAFIFTIVAPPGALGESSSDGASVSRARRQLQPAPMLYKRSAEDLLKDNSNSGSAQKVVSASGIDDALKCVDIGSNMMENGVSSSEAAKGIVLCFGKVSIPNIETIAKLEQDLASALFSRNRDAAMDFLIKAIQYDVIEGPKSA